MRVLSVTYVLIFGLIVASDCAPLLAGGGIVDAAARLGECQP